MPKSCAPVRCHVVMFRHLQNQPSAAVTLGASQRQSVLWDGVALGVVPGDLGSFWGSVARHKQWLARLVPGSGACCVDGHGQRDEAVPRPWRGSKPQRSAVSIRAGHVASGQSPGRGIESRARLMEETTRLDSTRLDSTSTWLDWAAGLLGWAEPCAAQAVPSNKRQQSDCVPFLNGILLATEENHTATVLVPGPALIRRCYMLPSLPRPDPSSTALLLHMHLPLLRASRQRPILHPPPPPTLPPRPTPPLPIQHGKRTYTQHPSEHTRTYTRTQSDPAPICS